MQKCEGTQFLELSLKCRLNSHKQEKNEFYLYAGSQCHLSDIFNDWAIEDTIL